MFFYRGILSAYNAIFGPCVMRIGTDSTGGVHNCSHHISFLVYLLLAILDTT